MKEIKNLLLRICKLLSVNKQHASIECFGYETYTNDNIKINVSANTEVFCNLNNTKVINFAGNRKIKSITIEFTNRYCEIDEKDNSIKNDPTIILYDSDAGYISHLMIPIPFDRYVAGGRFEMFDPFYACMVLNHFWISDKGYVIIGSMSFKMAEVEHFNFKEFYKKIAECKYSVLDTSFHSYKDDIGLVQKIHRLHTEIQKLKYEEEYECN